MSSFQEFCSQFAFTKSGGGLVGVEREAFLLRDGAIAPIAAEVLRHLPDCVRYGYELSACQLEDRIGPTSMHELLNAIKRNEKEIAQAERALGFKRLYQEVAPADMPLDVYPDPTGRYQRIIKDMPQHILLAACRVTGIHIHIGMPDADTAMRIYNKVISHCDELCHMGDGSKGERLNIYKTMAPDFQSPHYETWKDFYGEAVIKGFDVDPRKCWHLIRISKHGTIEFRMFGATHDLQKIVSWARTCHDLCEGDAIAPR
jgi:gamma-glutamyl:cysteine ligase YbdK (ATP-grasp superfamily)